MSNRLLVPGIAPTLETERLLLRPHRLDDFADCAAMWADPAVTRYIGGKPQSAEDSWARLMRHVGHWRLLGFGYWALEERATGRYTGEAGFADFKRTLEPPLDGVPEAGWALAARSHGKGYATEALRAIVSWGDAHFDPPRTACLVHPQNLASIRLAEKLGYREQARATYKGQPTILFRRVCSR